MVKLSIYKLLLLPVADLILNNTGMQNITPGLYNNMKLN